MSISRLYNIRAYTFHTVDSPSRSGFVRMRWHTDAHLVNDSEGSSSDLELLKMKNTHIVYDLEDFFKFLIHLRNKEL